MRILIPDAMRRNVLAAIRALGRRGHSVTLAVPTRHDERSPSRTTSVVGRVCRSRFCTRVTTITSPFDDVDGYVADILASVMNGEYDVVLPFSHSSVASVCYGKDSIEKHARVPFADFTRFMSFHDKLNTMKLADRLGVPAPETYWPLDLEDAAAVASRVAYPVVVKARIGCGVRQGVRYARNREELLRMYRSVASNPGCGFLDDFERPLIQEYIPGKTHDVATLSHNGSLRGALTQMRALTYPFHGGIGAVNVTTNEPKLLRMAASLLEAVGWHGPALVEFKLDARDGMYRLMEVNPKFWGTLALSIAAGIDFPTMACEMAVNGDVEPAFDYEVGMTYRWLIGEEILSVMQDRHRADSLKACARRFLSRKTRYDFSFTDPMPDIRRMVWTAGALARGRTVVPPEEEVVPF